LEYERLQSEASQLGSQLAQALAEGEASSNFAQEQTQKLAKLNNENTLLQKQLDDLGCQVQTLLREIARRDDPTIPPDEELGDIPAALDTESLITDNLVSFKSIDGLQQKNQMLLKIVRELGQAMENEEKEYREAMEKEQTEAIKEAHEAMQELAAQLERQKTSSDSIIQAYVKERDTLRTMLARSEKNSALPQAATLNGAVVTTGPTDLARELQDVHGQFEAYRKEMGVDSGRLRDELIAAQREVNQTGAMLAKANAKIEYLTG
jgi:nucleoprotein TPR